MKKIEINLTDEQLQWLRDHYGVKMMCYKCPLYDQNLGPDLCEQIVTEIRGGTCNEIIKYALTHANKS